MRSVSLVATDVAPSRAFERVSAELQRNGATVNGFLADGKLPQAEASTGSSLVGTAQVVLTGMSSSLDRARPEIDAANEAKARGIPYGFYADTYNVFARPWFADLLPDAAFLFLINEVEKRKTLEKFPELNVVVTGNPLWEDFCFPKHTRAEVRQKLAIPEDKLVVLSPGIKSPVINILMWGSLVQELSGDRYHLILAPHPGDPTPLPVYDDLVNLSPGVPVQIVTKAMMPTSDLLPAVDIIVDSVSTIGIEAAHLRKPVVCYLAPIAQANLERQTGTKKWEPCELGALHPVYADRNLYRAVHQLLTDHQALKKRQEEIYPVPPERGAAVRKMIATLEALSALSANRV